MPPFGRSIDFFRTHMYLQIQCPSSIPNFKALILYIDRNIYSRYCLPSRRMVYTCSIQSIQNIYQILTVAFRAFL